jgi:hypothetical protein
MGAVIDPAEQLSVAYRKRLVCTYVVNDDGERELRIDHGMKEISFDDERFFAFGEQLAKVASFTGHEATGWGDGYTWDEIGPLLEALLDEGVLQRGEATDDPRGSGLVESPVPPSACPFARSWSAAECEAITGDLGDRPVEVGYLEAVVPAVRIAHPALDADDRQVGEANVFPARLRLDRPTDWRVCQYPGSRYRDDMPMNVTALRAMIKHWKPILVATLAVRDEVAARLGRGAEPWTLGELHVLSSAVLALPAFALLRGGGSSPQRPLHPVLSSLFRVTDGVRLTAYEMLFSIEKTRRPEEPMTAADLYTRAEQEALLTSPTGVCSGPPHMIEEFLRCAVDGVRPDGLAGVELPGEIAALFDELPAAIDYALYSKQSWGVSLSAWLAMSRAYEALIAIATTSAAGPDAAAAQSLRARLGRDWAVLERLQIASDHDRDVHWRAYVDAYQVAHRALREPVGPATLAGAIAVGPLTAVQSAAARELHDLLAARAARGELAGGAPAAARIAEVVIGYLREEQAILAATTRIQDAINTLLDRPRPTRPLETRDFRVHFVLGHGDQRFPHLLDALGAELGIAITCTASAITISDQRAAQLPPHTTRHASSSAGGQ